jgi:hypothetical protein
MRVHIKGWPFEHCASSVGISHDAEAMKEAAIVSLNTGACYVQTYASAEELRAIAKAAIKAAESLEAAQ